MTLVEKEMNAARHLLYVSLKYTKTGDVILNLIQRWKQAVEETIGMLLTTAKKKKLVKTIPATPKEKVEVLLKVFKKEKLVMDTLELYSFFMKIHTMESAKEHEFRKNVTLRVQADGTEVVIDMEKLKEWSILLESFIQFARTYTS